MPCGLLSGPSTAENPLGAMTTNNSVSPIFSVIIPTFSRREDLQRTLIAYEAQLPTDLSFEVVVVDDGSTDDTQQFLANYPLGRFHLTVDRQNNQGPAAARNRGLAHASGEYILFTGDDITPEPDLLARHLEGHRIRNNPGSAILGQIRWPDDLEITTTMHHIGGRGAEQFSYHYMVDGEEYDFRHLYTSNISLSRDLLDQSTGYFSTDFPAAAFEDAELAYRLVPHGLKIHYCAGAVAYHYHHYTARSFFERQLKSGRMARILVAKYPETESLLGLETVKSSTRWVRLVLHWRRRRYDRLVRDLDSRVETALSLAEALDTQGHQSQSAEDPAEKLLRALFRYAYLRGVIESSCSSALIEPVSARLFERLVEPQIF